MRTQNIPLHYLNANINDLGFVLVRLDNSLYKFKRQNFVFSHGNSITEMFHWWQHPL